MVELASRFGMGRVYLDAAAEARRRGDRRVSTEHLALALLVDPDSVPARALGVSLGAARAALQELDRDALATLGISTPSAGPVLSGRGEERLQLTPAARGIFTGLRREAKGERLGVQHVLIALLRQRKPDPAAELLDALAVDRTAVRDRLGEP